MNRQAELLELIRQAQAHLRYYQELGVTHLGVSATLPAEAAAVASRAEVAAVQPLSSPEKVSKPVLAKPLSSLDDVFKGMSLPEVEPLALPISAQNKTLPAAAPTVVSTPPAPAIIPPMTKKKTEDVAPSLFGETVAPPPAAALPVLANETPIQETLEAIRLDLGNCQRCKLYKTRTNIVFGEGIPTADLMFVGEAPGADEDATGRPFVGRAGQLLTKMIEAIDLKRDQVYIANVLKSRPPNNRNPEKDEVEACKPFLWRQIAVIKPKLIVTLGNPATQLLLETKVGITRLRGEFQEYPRIPGIKVIPTFHPAYLLRSPDKKREAWEDLKKVRAFLRGEISA